MQDVASSLAANANNSSWVQIFLGVQMARQLPFPQWASRVRSDVGIVSAA
jgi:hypothetical protein